jgi:hypothetical protein
MQEPWSHPRVVAARTERGDAKKGLDVRYVVINVAYGAPASPYHDLQCPGHRVGQRWLRREAVLLFVVATSREFVINDDTAQFSVNSIRHWLDVVGQERYAVMKDLVITADGSGRNRSSVKSFKLELQKMTGDTRLSL